MAILDGAFAKIPVALAASKKRQTPWKRDDRIASTLLAEDPQAIADVLLEQIAAGASMEQVAGLVVSAAALRITQFHTSNEYADWDTALHTFTFASAIQRSLRRSPSAEVLRGVFDAAMSVYLDRFLNVPAARLPEAAGTTGDPESLLAEIEPLFDQRHQVQPAAGLAVRYLAAGGRAERLIAGLAWAVLREDRDFHSLQTLEAAAYHAREESGTTATQAVLVAAARYLAAHCPTARAELQTYRIALRLARGERLFEGE